MCVTALRGCFGVQEVAEVSFSILYDTDAALNFVARTKEDLCMWTDGLNALMGKPMSSDMTNADLEMLIGMEMKLRLLDLENITIPETAPPVPNEPSNYNFTYNFS
uniref:PH domain-containing protein n=1 Tax=Eptatretus burgeri TaxID=7764 RepID=A0A8C4NKJ1_EPTBU